MKAKLYALLVICIFSNELLQAQAPGGVSTNLKLWIKADNGVAATAGAVNSWTYSNDGTKSFTATGTQRPTVTTQYVNFRPALTFNGTTNLMDGPNGANAPIAAGDDDYTVIAVWRSTSASAFQRVWSQRNALDNDNGSFSLATWNDGTYGDETATAPFQHTFAGSYTAGNWNISQLSLSNTALNDLTITDLSNLNGTSVTVNTDPANTNGAALRAIGTAVNRLGANYAGGNASSLIGDIAELIVYDATITTAQRNQIFGYLMLKYGLSAGGNVVSSAGTTIWNSTTNTGYNNFVFGIGRDDASGISSTQSNHSLNGSGNGTGISGRLNLLISNPSATIADNSFLLVGNDAGSLTEITTDLPPAATGSSRMGREWKVQSTGTSVGTVSLAFNVSGLTVTGTTASRFKVMVDADGDGDFTTGTVRYYSAASFAGNVATFNNVTLNNGEVFALITFAGSTTLPVTWISFNAARQGSAALLNWVVGENETAKQYEIEVSKDGTSFTKAGVVLNDPNKKSYSFNYPSLSGGKTFFRIYQVDFDGRYSYSKTVTLEAPFVWLTVLNNPVRTNSLNLDLEAQENGRPYSVEIISLTGATIVSKQGQLNAGKTRIAVPMDKAPAGNYILKVSSGGQSNSTSIIKY